MEHWGFDLGYLLVGGLMKFAEVGKLALNQSGRSPPPNTVCPTPSVCVGYMYCIILYSLVHLKSNEEKTASFLSNGNFMNTVNRKSGFQIPPLHQANKQTNMTSWFGQACLPSFSPVFFHQLNQPQLIWA